MREYQELFMGKSEELSLLAHLGLAYSNQPQDTFSKQSLSSFLLFIGLMFFYDG
jgi:hypothetical protein